MSILINEAYASPTVPLWASFSGGGGPMTPVNIPAIDTLTFATQLDSGDTETIWTEAITLPDGLWQFNIDVLTIGTLDSSSVGYFTVLVLYSNDDGAQYVSYVRDFSVPAAAGTNVFNLRLQVPVVDAVAKNGTFSLVLSNVSGANLEAGWQRLIANYSKILLTTDFTYVPPPV